jgi:ABC-type multidrug transport system ATPase subunit
MQLKLSHLNKTYSNRVKALNNLSLDIGVGMFGLLGPNGAGKSTLMRTIATLQEPDSGTLFFGDIDMRADPTSLRKVLGYLPQEFGVYPRVTAENLLDYFATLKGLISKKDRAIMIQQVLEITNLYDVRKKYVSGYSGGMKQRFGIAQLLLNKPKLLIVDEPTAGLDPAERTRFLNVIRSVAADNVVIFSTHIVDDVKDLCKEMAVMNKGQIVKQLRPADGIKSLTGKVWIKTIEPAMLGQFETTYQVLSSGYDDKNKLVVRIYAEQHLGESFIESQPTLEDVYFYFLHADATSRNLN